VFDFACCSGRSVGDDYLHQEDTNDLMLKYAKAFVKKKFNFNLDILLKQSKLLDQMKRQKRYKKR